MKRKDLYEYIRQEIINELTETPQQTTITNKAGISKVLKIDDADASTITNIKTDPNVQSATIGATKLKEMSRHAAVITIGDSEKVQLAKEIYGGSDIEKIIDLVVSAGEEGITQEKISEVLGIRFNELTQSIKDLTKIGAFSKPQKSIDTKPTPELPVSKSEKEPEKDDWEQDEEPEKDDWEKPEEPEESEEEKPKIDYKLIDKDTSKITKGQSHGIKLSPEYEEKYTKISLGIKAKIARLEDLPKNERIDSPDYPVLKKLLSSDNVQKLYKAKGVNLPTMPSVIVK